MLSIGSTMSAQKIMKSRKRRNSSPSKGRDKVRRKINPKKPSYVAASDQFAICYHFYPWAFFSRLILASSPFILNPCADLVLLQTASTKVAALVTILSL
jgi:hypothetical protein